MTTMVRAWLLLLFCVTLSLWVASAFAVDPPPSTGELSIDLVYPSSRPPEGDRYLLLYDPASGPPPDPYRYWRIPDNVLLLPRDGVITVAIAPGEYWFSIAHKKPGTSLGPPSAEEFFYLHADDGGKAAIVTIEKGKRLSLGRRSAVVWTPARVEREKGVTAIEGVVVDPAGKPLPGLFVFAATHDLPTGKPLYISDTTDGKGGFLLRVAEGGVYFLRARGVVGGGTPAEGEYLSTIGEFAPLRVELKRGERLKGIRLVARPLSRTPENRSLRTAPLSGGGKGP